VSNRLLALAVLLVAAALCLTVPAAAQAVAIGVGDQKTAMFDDQRFQDLGLRHARLTVAWDALTFPWQREELDRWLAAAHRAGVQPLITFGHSRVRRRQLPTPARLRFEFRQFRTRYPWVRTFATWNEANHCGEPTCHKPWLVAAYWRTLQSECRLCTVVAAELLDMPNMIGWVREFRRHSGAEPRHWGLHNYIDTNRFRTASTRRLLRAVRGDLWLTEVGGLVARRNRSRTRRLDASPAHAAKAMRWLFERLVPLSSRIRRVYIYHWSATGPLDTWDSALLDPLGHERPAFHVLKARLARRSG